MNFATLTNMKSTRNFEYKFNDSEGKELIEKIKITFKTHFQTAAFMDAFRTFQQTENCSILAEQLSKNLTEWNLDWNGEEFPPTYENLSERCRFDFLLAIVNEMLKDADEGIKELNLKVLKPKSETEKQEKIKKVGN